MNGWIRPTWHFVRHFLEMCAAMCIGLGALGIVFLAVARFLGYDQPLVELPEVTALVVAFNMSLPMAAWMRFRRMQWRPILEMSGAMFVEAIVLIGVFWLGLIPAGVDGLYGWQHGLMMPAMLVPMLLRLDLYTGRVHYAERPAIPVTGELVHR